MIFLDAFGLYRKMDRSLTGLYIILSGMTITNLQIL